MTVLRICFIGDSITNGTGDDAYLGWPGRLCAGERARGHDLTNYNLGIRADTSPLIERRWRAECEARLPQEFPAALVFAFGINDTAEEPTGLRVNLDLSAQTTRRILAEAASWKPTLMIGPTPVDETKMPTRVGPIARDLRNARIAKASRVLEGIAAEVSVPYLDLYSLLAKDAAFAKSLAAGDGVHPTAEGYAIMAARIGAWSGWRRWLDKR